MRKGDFKLIEFFEDGRLELYDLRHDPAESRNIAASHPEHVTRLHSEMSEWRRAVGAEVPTALADSNGGG